MLASKFQLRQVSNQKEVSRVFRPQAVSQQSLKRALGLASEQCCLTKPCVDANEVHRFIAPEKLQELGVQNAALVL